MGTTRQNPGVCLTNISLLLNSMTPTMSQGEKKVTPSVKMVFWCSEISFPKMYLLNSLLANE